jgi:hypothetical protein
MRLGHRVSPPWFGFALATTAVFCGLISVSTARSAPQTTAGLRQPLSVGRANADVEMRFPPASALRFAVVAYANRSWCTTFVWSEISDLVGANSHVRKSGGRQPAVVRGTTAVS